MPTLTATRASLFSSVPSAISYGGNTILGITYGGSSYQYWPPIRTTTLSALGTTNTTFYCNASSIDKTGNYGGGTAYLDGKRYSIVDNSFQLTYGTSYNFYLSGTTEIKSITTNTQVIPDNSHDGTFMMSSGSNGRVFISHNISCNFYGSSYSYQYNWENCGSDNAKYGYFYYSGGTYYINARTVAFPYNFSLDWTNTQLWSSKYKCTNGFVEVSKSARTGATTHSNNNFLYFRYAIGSNMKYKCNESTTWYRQIDFLGATTSTSDGHYIFRESDNNGNDPGTINYIPQNYKEDHYYMRQPVGYGQNVASDDHTSPCVCFYTSVNYVYYGGAYRYASESTSQSNWYTTATKGGGMTPYVEFGNSTTKGGVYVPYYDFSTNAWSDLRSGSAGAGVFGLALANLVVANISTRTSSSIYYFTGMTINIEYNNGWFEGNYHATFTGSGKTYLSLPYSSSYKITHPSTLYLWAWVGPQTNNGDNITRLYYLGKMNIHYEPKGYFTVTKY